MISYSRIVDLMEWFAVHHKKIQHVPSADNQVDGTTKFARYNEWQDLQKTAMGYPRILLPNLMNGAIGYNYGGMHTDTKTIVVQLLTHENQYEVENGFGAGMNAIDDIESILHDIKTKIVDWRDNDPAMGSFPDVIGRMDIERINYREIGPRQLGDGCWGIEVTFAFVINVGIEVDNDNWG